MKPFVATVFAVCLLLLPTGVLAHEGHQHPQQSDKVVIGNPAGSFDPQVSIQEMDGYRVITSNGLPAHATGKFPGPGNPNRISAQQHRFRMPLRPEPAAKPTALQLGNFGVAVNGIPIDPGAAEFWRGQRGSQWQYAVIDGKIDLGLDHNNAHVQPTGAYHYHGRPVELIESLRERARKAGKNMTLIGYAADGYPLYDCELLEEDGQKKRLQASYELKAGTRPAGNRGPGGKYDGTFIADWEYKAGSGDLDEFNGRTGKTPEYPEGTFYYVMTADFPYVPRLFKGQPDRSFQRRRGGPPGGFRPGRRPPPPGFPPFGFGPPPGR